MQIIPLTSDPIQRFTVNLDGTSYDFQVKYNDLSSTWSADIALNSDGTPLAYGIPLVLGADVLSGTGLGIGAIFMVDESSNSVEAGPDDLGDRVRMYYATPAEVASLAG